MHRRLPGTRAFLFHPRRLALLVAALVAQIHGLAVEPAATERIPVLAWSGPPQAETNAERYRELADAGFTHNYSGFGNVDAMEKALDVARAAGIRQFINIPELATAPEKVAERFKSHPAIAGYYLRDEPSAADFPQLAAWTKRIQTVDAVHPCYINLFPNYANAEQLGTATYQEHLDRFVKEVPVPWISFDHYPVVGKTVRGEWYENLEQVRTTAKAAKKPFWAFALAVAHDPYPIATLEHLRLQVFSNLAYGAQGIQYFTYWTVKSPHWNFHEGPINTDGKRTAVYDRVKQVNSEIKALSPVFLGAEVMQVSHTGNAPRGTRSFESEAPIVALNTGNAGALVSHLNKNGLRYVVIVNRELHASMPLTVKFEAGAKVSEFRKDGVAHPLAGADYSSELSPGDVRVFSWTQER
jgi:hypothetical protein